LVGGIRGISGREALERLSLFDVLIEIIRVHGKGGAEAQDGVELELA